MATQTLVSLREARDRTIAVLSDLFAKDDLDLDDFERRVSLVHRAASVAEVEKAVEGLAVAAPAAPAPAAVVPAPAPKPQTALVPASNVQEHQTIVAIMGGAGRQGAWTAPRQMHVVAIMGGSVLDFREARMGTGVTEIVVLAVMGGVHIIVPPELAVETHGAAIMGGFEHVDRQPPEDDPERPVLRVHGFALMGGVAVETRIVGESEREARRRRKRERKALKGRAS
jgi:hypothetical protein